jgi:CheY-like chemotaxis protein
MTGTTAGGPPLRVLVADDDEEFRRALEGVLRAVAGVELVGSASDGMEAVRLFSALEPDVVLMDLVMPRCDGIEATKRIIEIEPRARVIALTAAEDLRMVALCIAAGAKGCLKKGPDAIPLVPLMLALAPATTGILRPVQPDRSDAGEDPLTDTSTPGTRRGPSRPASHSSASARP